jgi:flagellar biosynthesis/type III secretory pathway M-ring protein FliF/YscJ
MIERVLVGALALLAVGMMLMMVRKAGKKVELPTPEELVGIPPALTSDSDIVGEADETDTPMTGIEVDDDQAQANKMLEQVTDLVQNNPETAAKLIGRWSSLDD